MSATVALSAEAKMAAKQASLLASSRNVQKKHKENLDLVSYLPQRLLNFFAKYPPEKYSAAVAPLPARSPPSVSTSTEGSETTQSTTATATATAATTSQPEELPSPYTPDRTAKGSKRDPTIWSASKAMLYTCKQFPNPFLPLRNPKGEYWAPKYGLRQQADLVKLAKKYGVEELLPTGRKSTIFKETRRAERGLAIKGTGIGQKVKGHKWERTMETRLEDRRKAMLEMPELIRSWKQRGHGRGWKKWPKR